jgi:hypothetical protein
MMLVFIYRLGYVVQIKTIHTNKILVEPTNIFFGGFDS